MKEKLSTELLLKVISYLQPKDKRQGLLVCKDWYQPFLYGLYYEIQIETPRQLGLLFLSLINNTKFTPNGHYTKIIRIHKRITLQNCLLQERVIIPFTLFQKLPDLCPNLEILNFDTVTWKFISFSYKIAQWKGTIKQLPTMTSLGTSLPFLQCLGKGLTCLSIQSGMLLDVATHHRLFSIISLTPNLEHFSIVEEGYVPPATLSLTLQDIELIHTVLPRLESFAVTGDRIELSIGDPSPDQLFLIDQIPTQSHTIKKIDWNTILTPITWLHYITHKYPYIKDLTVSISPSSSSPPLCQPETSFYIQLVTRCKYLETISLASPSLCHWFNPSFFQTLSSTTVRQVRPILRKEKRIQFESELTLASKYSHFITTLEIDQWRFNIPFTATLDLLSLLPNLVHLELRFDSYKKQYSIESILHSCPLLTHLALKWGSLTVTSLPSGKTKYRLQTLELTFIAFDPTLFQYLGNQCKSLSTLALFKCKQSCQLEYPSTHTVIALDMPDNAFDLIMIDGVRLDYSHADLYMHGISRYVRLASIQKQSTLNQRWYRHTGYTSVHKRSPILLCLDPKDAALVETYFKNRKMGPYKEKEKTGSLGMEFGYVEIKCKSLKKFILDGDIR